MKIAHLSFLSSIMIASFKADAQQENIHDMSWTVVAEIPAPPGVEKHSGLAGVCAGISNNALLIAGGANFPDGMPWEGGSKKYWDQIYVLRKKGTKFNWFQPGTFSLNKEIAYAASVTVPKGMVIIGGETSSGLSKEVFLLEWSPRKKEIEQTALPSLPYPLANAVAVISGSVIYLAGGEMKDSVSDQFWKLEMHRVHEGWKRLPVLPVPVSHTALVLHSVGHQQYIYLMGGRCKKINGISELYTGVYQFDLSKNIWTEKRSLPYALSAGTGIANASHEILLFGGDKGITFHQVEELMAAIHAEKNESKKQFLINKKNSVQASHPGFSKEVLTYRIDKNEWAITDLLPFETPVTTTLVKWGNRVILPSGEIKAGIRSPQIWSTKIKNR